MHFSISIQHVSKSFAAPAPRRRRSRGQDADFAYAASVSGDPAVVAAAAVQATDEAASTLASVLPDGTVSALTDINLEIVDGDIFRIIGMSGAGKSTLVRTINLLERPTSGKIVVDGQDVTELSGASCAPTGRRVSMIFQNFGLLAQKTVLENVCFPFVAATGKVTAENARARPRPACARRPCGEGIQLSQPAVRRPEAARGDRPRARLRTRGHPL